MTWVRFHVTNVTTATRDWILEMNIPGGDHTIYFRDTSGQTVEQYVSGSSMAYNARPMKRRTLAFSLSHLPGETRTYHLKRRMGGGRVIPLTIWDAEAFAQHDLQSGILLGTYIGILLALALYNAALFFSLKDEVYGWYVAVMLLMVLFAATYYGIAAQYFWPDWATGRDVAFGVTNGLWGIAISRFVQIFLNTKHLSPFGHKLMWGFIGFGVFILLAPLLGISRTVVYRVVYHAGGLAMPFLIFGLAVIIWRRGYRPARFFLVAWSTMLAGLVVAFLRDLGFLPFTPLTIHMFWAGSAIEGILLSFALGDRINILRREREEQEAAAIEAERVSSETREQSERKSAFLASMAHELRTPMNAIKGFTNLVIRREPSLTERGHENLTKVNRASDHLLAMINDLLDLSKIEAGRMDVTVTTFDVRSVILDACEVVSPLIQEGVELRREIANDVGEAHTDQQRLSQMLINLLSNAIKFTDTGSVTVAASLFSADVQGSSGQRREQLVISVADTGKGIPESDIPSLFDEYRQVDGQSESVVQKGTGLGLSITKRFAELLGGSISVVSEMGAGSTFKISIPLSCAVQEAGV